MDPTSKKFISLFLIFSLITINCATFRSLEEKRERKKYKVNLVVQKTNGQQVSGELMTVKRYSILLLNTEGKDVSVGIEDIRIIIVKKSNRLPGNLSGAVIGGVAGAILGLAAGDTESDFIRFRATDKALLAGIALGALGFIFGGLLVPPADKKIQIEGMTNLEIQETMDKLRKKARIRDYK